MPVGLRRLGGLLMGDTASGSWTSRELGQFIEERKMDSLKNPHSPLWDELCVCGHKRVQHFVGGPISDCDECACEVFEGRKESSEEKSE